MPDRPRSSPNLFFVALMAASTVFVVTCFAYLIGPYLVQRAANKPAKSGSLGFVAWLDRRGPLALGIEFCVMLALGTSAICFDHWFNPKTKTDRPSSSKSNEKT